MERSNSFLIQNFEKALCRTCYYYLSSGNSNWKLGCNFSCVQSQKPSKFHQFFDCVTCFSWSFGWIDCNAMGHFCTGKSQINLLKSVYSESSTFSKTVFLFFCTISSKTSWLYRAQVESSEVYQRPKASAEAEGFQTSASASVAEGPSPNLRPSANLYILLFVLNVQFVTTGML